MTPGLFVNDGSAFAQSPTQALRLMCTLPSGLYLQGGK